MGKIAILDQHTIDQIAAGEVVERPASVVKELVENSIDAGATQITVEIREGGIGLIRITDNGSGMEKEDIPVAFLRHATSKIRSAEDLSGVASLGFRGEALSSISAVAMVELITKTRESASGTRFCMEGGVKKTLEDIGAPDGTTFIIRNLFYNTPARKKFLKSEMSEASAVHDLLMHLAMSHPEVAFKVMIGGQMKIQTSGNGNLKDVIYQLYGRETAMRLISVERQKGPLKISGWIGKPEISRGNRNYETYFVNGRYVKSKVIAKGIEDGYKSFMMQHRYPFVCLNIQMDGKMLDVNVHPTKMELRFSNQNLVYDLLVRMTRDALSGKELIPEVTLDEPKTESKAESKTTPPPQMLREPQSYAAPPETAEEQNLAYFMDAMRKRVEERHRTAQPKSEPRPELRLEPRQEGKPAEQPKQEPQPVPKPEPTPQPQPVPKSERKPEPQPVLKSEPKPEPQPVPKAEQKAEQLELFDGKLLSKEAAVHHMIIGQLFDTYWLVQYADKLYMIDQHAAHEKVLYERMMKDLKNRTFQSQMISPPIILNLSMQEEERFLKYQHCFEEIGFEIESFGEKSYAVRAVPANLPGVGRREILMEMIDSLSDLTGGGSSESLLDKVASMSCKAAVKGNHQMSVTEAKALIDELLSLENPYHCPHGRPTIISMSKYELEKKFKRIV